MIYMIYDISYMIIYDLLGLAICILPLSECANSDTLSRNGRCGERQEGPLGLTQKFQRQQDCQAYSNHCKRETESDLRGVLRPALQSEVHRQVSEESEPKPAPSEDEESC